MGGVRAIYVGLRSQVGSFSSDDTWSVVPDDSGGNFKRIAGRGSFQTVAQVDETTGLTYWRDELQFTPAEDDGGDLTFLSVISAAAPDDLIVIVEPWNESSNFSSGKIMGIAATNAGGNEIAPFPVFFSGGQYVTGTERTDANGQSFTLTSVHPFPALSTYLGASDASNPSTD